TLCTLSGSGDTENCPSSNPQFNLTVPAGSVAGDTANFGLLAASADLNTQKKLQFGPSASGFNNGHSKIEIDSTGGFQLTSSAGNPPSLMDWIGSGSTYYTFVDSGAFTAIYS